MIVVDSILECDCLHQNVPAIAVFQSLGYEIQIVDAYSFNGDLAQDRRADWPTVLQLFVRGMPHRGSAGLHSIASTWFEFLVERGTLQGLAVFGSPYVLDECLARLPQTIPYGFSYGQMAIAQRLVLEQLFPH